MAIVDRLPGVEVTVTVDGEHLKEYPDDQTKDKARTTTRYIEAVTASVFEICVKINQKSKFAGDVLKFDFYVDGAHVEDFILIEHQWARSDCSTSCEGSSELDGGLRKFRFATVETVSDDVAVRKDAKELRRLGTIEVRVRHKMLVGETSAPAPKPKKTAPKPRRRTAASASCDDEEITPRAKANTISEKAIKGETISHTVSFVDPEPIVLPTPRTTGARGGRAGGSGQPSARTRPPKKPEFTYHDTEMVEGVPNPAAKYIFKYRSLAALKSLMIIPRTPTPPPLEEADVATMSVDQLRELQKRAREFRDERESKAKIKREEGTDEPVARKKSRPAAGSTEVDLGDEDDDVAVVPRAVPKTQREVIELE